MFGGVPVSPLKSPLVAESGVLHPDSDVDLGDLPPPVPGSDQTSTTSPATITAATELPSMLTPSSLMDDFTASLTPSSNNASTCDTANTMFAGDAKLQGIYEFFSKMLLSCKSLNLL